jgi:hypothetical protein
VVRARVRRDLERFLQKLELMGTSGAGGREILEGVGTDYAYYDVWSRLYDWQETDRDRA